MCGIIGYMNKSAQADRPLGAIMLSMLQALGSRGPDSAGVALYGDSGDGALVLRIKLGEHGAFEDRGERIKTRVERMGKVRGASVVSNYLRLIVDYDGDLTALQRDIEASESDIEVISAGRRLEIAKQVGSPDDLDRTYGISALRGTHAIGHTRLSTESRVDLSHSQPFWAHGALDLATVHNGHITNYHKLRRQYEMKGHRFYTENDSEIIGMYLAERMRKGDDLEAALRASLRDLDGSFSYLVATADAVGFAKDPFGLKPLMVAETDAFVALATEEMALRRAFGTGFEAIEPHPKTVRVWKLPSKAARAA
jgi:glutamate synthase domain-containing protein 1